MIAELGIMLGFYLITRCLSFLHRPEAAIVKVFASMTLGVAIIFTFGFIIKLLIGVSGLK